MAIDYRERKPVGKNKPRKQPGKSLAGLLLGMACVGYVAGVISGWFFFHKAPPITIKQAEAPAPVNAAPPGTPAPPTQPGAPPPPLSFYETLPKGKGAVMGSGINLQPTQPVAPQAPPTAQSAADGQTKAVEPAKTTAPAAPAAPKTAATPAPAPAKATATAAPAPTKSAAPAATAAAKVSPQSTPAAAAPKPSAAQPAAKGPTAAEQPKPAGDKVATYTVQAASCQTKAEAEQIRARLAKAGHAAYIVEATVPGKGTWYRVRFGKGLSQAQAMDMASKAGAGAEIVSERTKSP